MDDLVDEIWDALRAQCCATRPHTDAKAVILVRRPDIVAVVKVLEAKLQAEHDEMLAFIEAMERQPPAPALVDLMKKRALWETANGQPD